MENLDVVQIVSFLGVLLVSATLHEMAHAAAAMFYGDNTAKEAGRITINPIPHIDPIMSILVPIVVLVGSGGSFVFGGAKPVPVDSSRFRKGIKVKRALMWVAAAGPISNFIIAFLCFWAANQSVAAFGNAFSYSFGYKLLTMGAFVNVLLGVFNLLPLPPLDGSKVIAGFMPDKMAIAWLKLERFAILFFLVIIFTPITQVILGPLGWMLETLNEASKVLVI